MKLFQSDESVCKGKGSIWILPDRVQMCRAGSYVERMMCEGVNCEAIRLECRELSDMCVMGESEEVRMNDRGLETVFANGNRVLVGMACDGKDCGPGTMLSTKTISRLSACAPGYEEAVGSLSSIPGRGNFWLHLPSSDECGRFCDLVDSCKSYEFSKLLMECQFNVGLSDPTHEGLLDFLFCSKREAGEVPAVPATAVVTVRQTVVMPYTQQEFNNPTVRASFKHAVATSGQQSVDRVTILSASGRSGRRSGVDLVNVDFSVQLDDVMESAAAVGTGGGLSAAQLNAAFETENIAPIVAVVTEPTIDIKTRPVGSDSDSPSCLDPDGDSLCHPLAYCVAEEACECALGTIDVSAPAPPGTTCEARGYSVRFVLSWSPTERAGSQIEIDDWFSTIVGGDMTTEVWCSWNGQTNASAAFLRSSSDQWNFPNLDRSGEKLALARSVEVNCLYASMPNEEELALYPTVLSGSWQVEIAASIYAWNWGTTAQPMQIPPAGMEVDAVHFQPGCAASGCWVVRGFATTGDSLKSSSSFSTLFLPHAVADSEHESDFDYRSGGNGPGNQEGVEWTFEPAKHPCTSASFSPGEGTIQAVTTCCISNDDVGQDGGNAGIGGHGYKGGFVANYRPTQAFVTWASAALHTCYGPAGETLGLPHMQDNTTEGHVRFPENPLEFLSPFTPTYSPGNGTFKNMPVSPGITGLRLLDPFFGQYKFEMKLDEVELRSLAGKLLGNVGVEHSIDTFVGFANFRATATESLDTFATQTAIHLEKTSFFSVSTHGVNAYTFLEYVNLRLVMVDSSYEEERSGSLRTNTTKHVGYVQVTFSMLAQYQPNLLSGGLIPLNSVRAGKGTFLSEVDVLSSAQSGTFTQVCNNYPGAFEVGVQGFAVVRAAFEDHVGQLCGPQASFCDSPENVRDGFVSFNIPLGKNVFQDASDSTIFVQFVINALDSTAVGRNANSGEDPLQLKTKLSASIPIVDGGINIFCDGVTAKTGLEDVATADLIVGSARDRLELSRLRILRDVVQSNLTDTTDDVIDSDSIEAGLLTLILRGDEQYFDNGVAASVGFSLELEDAISIHIMQDDSEPAPGDGTIAGRILQLLAESPADNADDESKNGHMLNGALFFTVEAGRATLEPTEALKAVCGFNPSPPIPNSVPLASCIARRDVRGRGFPQQAGADEATAVEIAAFGATGAESPAASGAADVKGYLGTLNTTSRESVWMTSVLGDSDYARKLGRDFATAVDGKYGLNGRYIRAYWINPGYEWTAMQTNGRSRFEVSQRIHFFALISLDENWPDSRRRMLLQSSSIRSAGDALQEAGSGVGRVDVSFAVTRSSLLANAYQLPEDMVASFAIRVQLSSVQACFTPTIQQSAIQTMLQGYLDETASEHHTAQVTTLELSLNGVSCFDRRTGPRSLLADLTDATADVTLMIAFKAEGSSSIDLVAFARKPGIVSVTQVKGRQVSNSDDVLPAQFGSDFNSSPEGSTDAGGSVQSTLPIITGVCGGAAGLLVAAGVVFYRRRMAPQEQVETAAAPISVDLTALQAEMHADLSFALKDRDNADYFI